jgi:hypothetical protein
MRLTTSAVALAFGFLLASCSTTMPTAGAQTMATEAVPLARYEAQVGRFKPERGLAAVNRNDVRLFIYDWFTHFEHASKVDFYLSHLDEKQMSVVFPGMSPLKSHSDFVGWYDNLLAQTLWNFHDLSAIQIEERAPQRYVVSFLVDWYGEVQPGSKQLAGWQSRSDSRRYHHKLRQTWTLSIDERVVIEKLVVSSGDTPSPTAG